MKTVEEYLPYCWNLYSDHKNSRQADQELNEAACLLIEAMLTDCDFTDEFQAIVKLQSKWSSVGAEDTHVRDIFYELIKDVCNNTIYDADKLWNKYFHGLEI